MECLVTKLKGVVSDSSLMGLNELRLTFHNEADYANKSISLRFTEATIIKALSGQISLQEGSNFGSSVQIPEDSMTTIYLSEGDVVISIPNKHSFKSLSNPNTDGIYLKDLDLDSLKYCENLVSFSSRVDEEVHGDVGSLKNLPLGVLSLNLEDPNVTGKVTGDISFLDNIGTKGLNNIFSSVTGTLKKLTVNNNLIVNTEDNSSWVDIDSENDVNSELLQLVLQTNVRKLNVDWLQKTSLRSFSISAGTKGLYDITLSGNLCKLYADKNITSSSMSIKNVKGTDVQNLSELPITCHFISEGNRPKNPAALLPFTWTSNTKSRTDIIALENVHFKSNTAQFIKDMSTLNNEHTSESYYQKIVIILADDLTSSAAAGDGALQTAISTLQGKGITVSIGYSDTAANGIALMSALDVNAPKYGIVYRGKELIIEPADTSKTLIAPANDCTYKEFNSLEEAKAFVSSNGLVKVESK